MSGSTKGWPLRLLHVPTMTSSERVGENTYNGQQAPEYNALSYTWGRWQCSEGPALKVRGISWAVPSVSSNCFSVEEFQKVIERASHNVSFIWLDVACIDQENRAVKMHEIGRQAAIFHGAKVSFIWLRSLDAIAVQEQAETLSRAASTIEDELIATYSPVSDEEMEYIPDHFHDYGYTASESPCLHDQAWVSTVKKILMRYKQDPWFTSLWTLQEMYIAPTAILLSRDSRTCQREDGNAIALGNLIIWSNIIYDAINGLSQEIASQNFDMTELNHISHLIEELGFVGSNFNNPCVLYSATRFRTATDPLDRVYGIMQVFEFQLGESIEPERKFTLEQLQIQLGAALNRRSPVWAQLFVRSQAAQPGRCWLVDQYSSIPQRLCFAETNPKSNCTIDVDAAERAHFKGKACRFQQMAEIWRSASLMLTESNEYEGDCAVQDILLDVTNLNLPAIAHSVRNLTVAKDPRSHQLGDELVKLFGEDLYILSIGVLVEAADDDGDESVGVIALRMNDGDQTTWQRIGVCLWSSAREDLLPMQGIVWHSFEGVLG